MRRTTLSLKNSHHDHSIYKKGIVQRRSKTRAPQGAASWGLGYELGRFWGCGWFDIVDPEAAVRLPDAVLVRAIEAKSDRTVSEEFFHDMLDEQFSEDETQRQLETAINWGRYAELFDYDAARGRFIQPEKLQSDTDESSVQEIDA